MLSLGVVSFIGFQYVIARFTFFLMTIPLPAWTLIFCLPYSSDGSCFTCWLIEWNGLVSVVTKMSSLFFCHSWITSRYLFLHGEEDLRIFPVGLHHRMRSLNVLSTKFYYSVNFPKGVSYERYHEWRTGSDEYFFKLNRWENKFISK